ncbi:MAG: hypothetical protein ISR91_04235 [Candidatus Delongbacteria bacterium]|nr:hypothetical protein [Candidatus Delongbacteria bacterium]
MADSTVEGGCTSENLPVDDHDVIYALRTAQQHQAQLSLVADQKANIVIGFSLIFLSVIQSQMFSAEFSTKIYFVPMITMAFLVFISFFMAILVVLPRTRTHHFKRPEEMPNPLFFGFFASVPEKNYVDYMMETLSDNRSARRLLLKDIYQIGAVLKKKYRLLRYSYILLALGALLSVIIFGIKLLI